MNIEFRSKLFTYSNRHGLKMSLKNEVLPVLVAGFWISTSEFVKDEFIVKRYWIKHYKNLGLVFPRDLVNGAVWGVWSLLFDAFIFIISEKYSLAQTTLIPWFAGFLLLSLVIGNLGVLYMDLLIAAVPLSVLEAFLASFLIKKQS